MPVAADACQLAHVIMRDHGKVCQRKLILQEDDAEGSMLRALRNVFAAQSVTPEVVSSIMSKVTSRSLI